MNIRRFSNAAELSRAVADRLMQEIQRSSFAPFGVMLAGGQTPLEAYRLVAEQHPKPGAGLHILFSDERYVPVESPESNYGRVLPLLKTLGLPEDRVLRVRTELPLMEAAQRCQDDLVKFFQRGGKISFGLLGLGADGHTASLFRQEDLERGKNRFSIPVKSPSGMDRVSVTPNLLKEVQRLVFVVTGPEKVDMVEHLLHQQDSVVAGRAVAQSPSVELYYAP